MHWEKTVQRLADEAEIRNLIAQLAHLADDGALGDYIQLFTEDAIWGGGGQPLRRGHDSILEGAKTRRASGVVGPGSTARHVVTTSVVHVTGETAKARSVFHFYINIDQQPTLAAMGVYDDTFVRTNDGWRLSKRLLEGSAKSLPATEHAE